MTDLSGCGLYTAGIVLGSTGSALVVVEKRPRAVTSPNGGEDYEDLLVITWHERIAGRLTDVVDRIAGRLTAPELRDECDAYVDVTELGLPARRLLVDREAYAVPIVIGGDEEKRAADGGAITLPLRTLQSRVTVALESERVRMLQQLSNGPTLLRGLEDLAALPAVGPTRDLAVAASIALWAAERHATNGPWAPRRPPPVGSPEWLKLRELDDLRRDEAEQGNDWWDPIGGGEP